MEEASNSTATPFTQKRDASRPLFYPVKPDTGLNPAHPLRSLRRATKNILSPFSEAEFGRKLFSFRIFFRKYVVCNAPEHVRKVFVEGHANYDKKSPQHRHALEPILGDGLFVSDGELWKERREACTPPLRAELMSVFVPRMVETATEVRDRWERVPAGDTVDLLHEMAVMTARIIGRTVFGDDVPEEEAAQVVSGFSEYQKAVEQIRFSDSAGIPFLGFLENPLQHRKAQKSAGKVHEIIDRVIARHRSTPSPTPNTLLDFFLQEGKHGGGCPMSGAAIRNESIVMFMAGHETTANTLAWCWYLLDGCPASRERLHAELDSVLGGRMPELEDVPRLVFTRAVIEETLRLYPPVPLLSRQAREKGTVGNQSFGPGTILLVIPWLLHRHKRYWENPDAFFPERFLPDQPRPDKYLFIPFSVGPRVCPGMRFGLTEAILCLAILAQRFSPKISLGHSVGIDCRLTLRPEGGLPATLEKRSIHPG